MKLYCAALSFSLLVLSGCATMGSEFSFRGPMTLVKGTTTKAEVLATYGNPFRVGYENGDQKWTYGYYKYKLFGDSMTKDLDVTFDKSGVVSSYSYSSSEPDEVKATH
jgi:hypothetical protein